MVSLQPRRHHYQLRGSRVLLIDPVSRIESPPRRLLRLDPALWQFRASPFSRSGDFLLTSRFTWLTEVYPEIRGAGGSDWSQRSLTARLWASFFGQKWQNRCFVD